MSTSRARELWTHGTSGERYLVEVEDGRVLSANGPLADDELEGDALAYKEASHGRMPAFTEEAADLERRRDEFERRRLG